MGFTPALVEDGSGRRGATECEGWFWAELGPRVKTLLPQLPADIRPRAQRAIKPTRHSSASFVFRYHEGPLAARKGGDMSSFSWSERVLPYVM